MQCVVDPGGHIAFSGKGLQHRGVFTLVSAGEASGVDIYHKAIAVSLRSGQIEVEGLGFA